jgi:hypothetical protein
MNIAQLVRHVNRITDEEVEVSTGLDFANDAIARINVKCDTNFPFFNENQLDLDYPGFPETWQRTLLVPFMAGRIKQADSSQFEYSDAYGEFTDNMIEFKRKYPIPEEYQAAIIKSYAADFEGNYFTWGPKKVEDFPSSPQTEDDEVTVTLDGGEF